MTGRKVYGKSDRWMVVGMKDGVREIEWERGRECEIRRARRRGDDG